MAGAAMVLGAFLPWASTKVAGRVVDTTWGMERGRGVGIVVLGLAALALGFVVLLGRRFAGNRALLVGIGALGLAFVFLQSMRISNRVSELQFNAQHVRDLTQEQIAAAAPSNIYRLGLWIVVLGAIAVAATATLLPRQLTPRVEGRGSDIEPVNA